ncbi:MAG: NAD(+)/NADH kinase [Halanaerobiales bacterium]|nr:NAD(+)/NADH kinase [Halanaerobiales bacterium]
MDKAALIVNLDKKEAFTVAERAIEWFEERNKEFLIEEHAAFQLSQKDREADYERIKNEADYIIIIGGDGTFLHTSHHFIGSDLPLLGINVGHLGFLTDVETDELTKALEMIDDNNYNIEKRMMLKTEHYRNEEKINSSYALNDYVINRDPDSQMLKIELYINKELVNNFRGDGLIIATPTGSTAYSLSAGGPIINPRQVQAILITPICPHNLHLRPMVISDQEEIRIKVDSDGRSVKGCADGRQKNKIIPGDEIYISGADQGLSIIKLPDRTFYTIVKEKMNLA